jgi:glycosyltransferase involved in cell wall biosynthesis
MMRILFDARTVRPTRTGVGIYAYNLLHHLAALLSPDDHLCALFLRGNVPPELSAHKNPACAGNLEPIEVTQDYEHHPSAEIWENFSLISLARKLQIDLFHGPAFLIPWRRTPFRKVVTIHDLIAFRCPGNYPAPFQAYLKFIVRRSVKSADRVIADSNNTRDDLINLLSAPAEKIDVIPCGIAKPFRRLSDDERAQARRELARASGLNLPEHYLLYVGSFEPRKNHALLLQAFQLLKRKDALPHHLILVGKGGSSRPPDARTLTIQYASPETLTLYYNCADLFVFPSLYEGFGLPLLEAMACGVPIIALATSSIPEVAGDSALLLPPNINAEALAAQILALLADEQKRQDLIQKGLARAKTFSWHATAQKILSIYTQLTSNP